MTKLKLMGKNHSDELYTPEEAIKILLPYINKEWTIWECAWGKGDLANYLKKSGFKVIGNKDYDFLGDRFQNNIGNCIITNPPYSIKDKFLKRCYDLGLPFALLMPITALEGIKRQELYKKYGIQILFPKRRIDFNGKKAPWFYTAWFCWGLNLPKDLMFVEEQSSGDKK